MQTTSQPAIRADIINAGVDWITATAKEGDNIQASDSLARHVLERALDAGEQVKPESRHGYIGHGSEGFFHGHGQRGRLTIASGAQASSLWSSIHNTHDHVSRLDLQVTIWTHGEQPHLGVQAYRCLRENPPAKVRVKNVTLISNHPKGETCNVGKRISDQYGRIYDKAAEAGLGDERTVWRYEVEYKNRRAGVVGAHLARSARRTSEVAALVRRWFLNRGIEPAFGFDEDSSTLELTLGSTRRDTLSWFRDTLSKTIERQIERHGLERVLDALGLLSQLHLNLERSAETDANVGHRLSLQRNMESVRAELHQQLLLSDKAHGDLRDRPR